MNADQRINLVAKIAGEIAAHQTDIGPGVASQVSVWVSIASAIVKDAEARGKDPAPPQVTSAKDPTAQEEPSDEELIEKATSQEAA